MLTARAIFFPTHAEPAGSVELHGHEGKPRFDELS
jgi:hypothetical protein